MGYKLVCFDVDGTLVDNVVYSWELFHDAFKVDMERRKKAKESFYNKEISYLEWAKHDIKMWCEKKATKQQFLDAIKKGRLKLMQGARETLGTLRSRGYKLAIISGSLNIILEALIPDYKDIFDDVFLSKLYFDEKGSISKVEATEYDMDGKAEALKMIARREKIPLEECVFIGDHHNDVKIAEIAGLSIAFDAKDEELRRKADVVIDKKDLREILKPIIQNG